MATEIELKFIVTEQAKTALPHFLSQFSCSYQGKQILGNTYYETSHFFLRSHELGLRIRSFDEQHEMTLKTAGKVIAGLHQRPEYNIPLSEPKLALSLLPDDVWPRDCDIAVLEQQLAPLFTTNFTRETWLINYQSSEIELALDCGEIKSNHSVEVLNEIELELKQGNISDVLAFAQHVSQLGGLRLSNQSKAARGYRLAQPQELQSVISFPVLQVAEKSTMEQALQQTIEAALSHWQYHEELWLTGHDRAKEAIHYSIWVLRQSWVLWGGIIPRKATAKLREQLQQVEQLITSHQAAADICYQVIYTETKLALTQWIIDKQWLIYTHDKGPAKLASSFKRFADIMLSRTAKTLKEVFSADLSEQAFSDQEILLRRQIISFLLLAGAYPNSESTLYIDNWQRLLTAITDNQRIDKNKLGKYALAQPAFWLTSSPE